MKITAAATLFLLGYAVADLCPSGLGILQRYMTCCAASIPGVVAPDCEPITLSPTATFAEWRTACQVDNRWPYCCYVPVVSLRLHSMLCCFQRTWGLMDLWLTSACHSLVLGSVARGSTLLDHIWVFLFSDGSKRKWLIVIRGTC
ncbi:hypothetical protein B0T14DRAFT_235448 [Immersiella caudata]|uniref:Uncharacterized protein n=1 Tax=Immersiella caudata TaxID=314043 RepID=A0AA40C0L4_9PEZI|nr:hypothetical protein B0T14DRAFT_235448 [Immersiella caudata]